MAHLAAQGVASEKVAVDVCHRRQLEGGDQNLLGIIARDHRHGISGTTRVYRLPAACIYKSVLCCSSLSKAGVEAGKSVHSRENCTATQCQV